MKKYYLILHFLLFTFLLFSMAISVARRIGETDLASQWFWKAKELSGMFKWKYPTQIPGNIDWFPQPALKGNIEVPGWVDTFACTIVGEPVVD